MKRIIISFLVASLSYPVFASGGSKLRFHLRGKINGMQYLCVSSVGCVNIAAGNSGYQFPISSGEVRYIFLANGRNYRMYPQTLPASCAISLSEDKSLVVSGTVKASNDNMFIDGLRCSVMKAS